MKSAGSCVLFSVYMLKYHIFQKFRTIDVTCDHEIGHLLCSWKSQYRFKITSLVTFPVFLQDYMYSLCGRVDSKSLSIDILHTAKYQRAWRLASSQLSLQHYMTATVRAILMSIWSSILSHIKYITMIRSELF